MQGITLSKMKGRTARERLVQLSQHPSIGKCKDWALRLSREQLLHDVEPDPWLEGDIPVFQDKFQTQPRSGGALFKLVLRHLQDIKASIETGDTSQRSQLNNKDDETSLQVWLANELNNQAGDWYHTEREPEVDNRKRLDIRILRTELPKISMELKWADNKNRSYSSLKNDLTDQLVGRYLKAKESRFGIFYLAFRANKSYWQDDKKKRLSFEELIQKLQVDANDILGKRPDIEELKVIGIDFSNPNS